MAFIQHKRSSVPGLVPIAGELLDGEIALNTADGKAFIKKTSGTVVEISGGGGSGTVTSITAGTGLSGGTITTSGTIAVNYGTTSTTACVGNDSRLSDARTPTAHVHSAADITSGTLAIAQIPTGSTSTTVCIGNDSRLSDARTPLSHTHGNITNAGAIGSTSGLPIITNSGGVLTTGSFGSTAGTFCQGNDSRLSDARTPLSHVHSYSDITSGYPSISYQQLILSGGNVTLSTSAWTVIGLGTTTINLAAGTWFVTSTVTVLSTATTAQIAISIRNTAGTAYASTEGTTAATASRDLSLSTSCVIVLASATDIGHYGRAAVAGASVQQTCTAATGSGINATVLTAVRIA